MDNYFTMQYFEWYLPDDGCHWKRLAENAESLKKLGCSGVWIPPAYKATGTNDPGYGAYDLFDLGEFEQKGSRRTKYGTLEELQAAVEALHAHDLKVYGDAVMNHKAGADRTERVTVVKVNPQNREEEISEPYEIEAWTAFDFPGRGDNYSAFKWRAEHFIGTDYDQQRGEKAVFRFVGDNKQYAEAVSHEYGNYDYLMFTDIDYRHPAVVEEMKHWGCWFVDKLQLDGLRLDAIKHINEPFIAEFVNHVRSQAGRELYVVGEYWNGGLEELNAYLDSIDYRIDLFDVPLHYHFHEASLAGAAYDLRRLPEGSLTPAHPECSMTFVDNHDSEPGQALESWVEDWFKPLAYAYILLRRDGYPCVFYGDYYGIGGESPRPPKRELLDKLLLARRDYAYGEEENFFDDPHCIAWLRRGDAEHPGSGLVCVMSNADAAGKNICLGPESAGKTYRDCMREDALVTTDESGTAYFDCNAGSVSVWIPQRG